MGEKTRGIRNWTILIAVVGLLSASGLAMAQEGDNDTDDGEGPPWTQEGFEGWTAGTPGPPPWADGSDDDGEGPPFVGTEWTPGENIGPPPWADGSDDDGEGPPWTREGFQDWTPGTPGPPPWAGGDDDD